MDEETLFHAALARPSHRERAAFLDAACAGRPEVRAAVEALLAAHEASGAFLGRPPVGEPGVTVAHGTATADSPDPDATMGAVAGAAGTGVTERLETRSTAAADPGATGVHDSEVRPGRPASPTSDRGIMAAGAVIADRYVLQEKIGEGGMGEVWTARQTAPVKRMVALKLIRPGMGSRALLARFEQERQALALMDHPNIARVLDGGLTPAGQPFFAMELVNGLPLTRFCDEAGLAPRARLELFVPICQAVQHAHQKGIIHRDLKPANILVTLIDGRPVPKVIDFGVAKAVDAKLTDGTLATQFGAIMGTLEYMAPEQAGYSGVDVDTRADIYSLGVILYELLTGLRPIDSRRLQEAALAELLRIIREEEPATPSTRLSADESLPTLAAVRQMEPRRLMALLRGELDWVVMKCLEKQRDRRYENASGLERDIRHYLADEPVEARPPSASYRLGKFLRRHRGAATATLLVALALLLGAAAATWQAVRATRARQLAVAERNAARRARDAEADAREEAVAARAQTERTLDDSRRMTARLTYERAQQLCEDGAADVGLLWMVRSLERTPPGSRDLDRAIRTSINLWARQLNAIRPEPRDPEWSSGTSRAVDDLAISPDGLSLLTVDEVGVVRLWERTTGRLRLTLPMEEDLPAAGSRPRAVFSPDGRFVAACRSDRRARVWLAASGAPVGVPLEHERPVTGVSFGPEGDLLATVAGGAVRFWDVGRGEPVGEPLTAEGDLSGVDFGRDGRRVLAWDADRLLVWDYPSREPACTIEGAGFRVLDAALGPDGRYVVAHGIEVASDGTNGASVARFWEVDTGRPVGARMTWRDRLVQGGIRCRFRPDGGVVAIGGAPVRLWEVPTGRPLGATGGLDLAEHVAWSPDGEALAAFGRTTVPRHLLDVAPGLEPDQVLAPTAEGYVGIDAGPDGRSVVISRWDGATHRYLLYDLDTGEALGDPVEAALATASIIPIPAAFSPDGRSVATPVGTHECQIREAATGRERGPRLGLTADVGALAFSPDGRLLAAGDRDGQVRIWEAATGRPVGSPIRHQHAVSRLRFRPDGRALLVAGGVPGGIAGEARLWDVATGEPLGPALELVGAVNDAGVRPDGRAFLTGAFEVVLWDAGTSERIWTAPTFGLTRRATFSPDGRRVLAVLEEPESMAVLLDPRTGLPTAWLKHESYIDSADFSPDGTLVLTGSADRTARLWDAATGLPLGPPWVNLERGAVGRFVDEGRSVLLREDAALVRRQIAGPIEGTPERLRLAVEAATRHSLTEHGTVEALIPTVLPASVREGRIEMGDDPYGPVLERLSELGGPPGFLGRE